MSKTLSIVAIDSRAQASVCGPREVLVIPTNSGRNEVDPRIADVSTNASAMEHAHRGGVLVHPGDPGVRSHGGV